MSQRVILDNDENGNPAQVWSGYTGSVTPTLGTPFRQCRAIYVGGAGTVIPTLADGSTPTLTAVAGQIIPVAATNISASSTATGLVALY